MGGRRGKREKVYAGISSVDNQLRGAALSVGNFDGVHLGHQRILRTAKALASTRGVKVAAMTFEPHPLALLRPETVPPRLTSWDEKARLLAVAGADAIIRLDTDWPLLSLSAEDFVREILVKRLHPSFLVEGPDFGFGRGRKGNLALLEAMAGDGGYEVRTVEPYRLTDAEGRHLGVSSTMIRQSLSSGDLQTANACLGRPYALLGQVVRGAGVGQDMGFPTINLDVRNQLIPAEAVYAGWAELAGLRARAAVSIGTRPTMSGRGLVVEAHVLDHAGDWYGQPARLELLSRLRGQERFPDREALVRQIAKDVAAVRAIDAPVGGSM